MEVVLQGGTGVVGRLTLAAANSLFRTFQLRTCRGFGPLSLGSERATGIKVHLLPRSSLCPSCRSRRKGIEKYNMGRETWKMWAEQSVSVSDKAEWIMKLVSWIPKCYQKLLKLSWYPIWYWYNDHHCIFRSLRVSKPLVSRVCTYQSV